MNKNIEYSTDKLKNYFSTNRIKWDQFYDSEKRIIESLNPENTTTVLDIGCGCGGLGLALREKFNVVEYTGIDIHKSAIDEARKMNPEAIFFEGDVLNLSEKTFKNRTYDVVFSLSCVDWNVLFHEMLEVAWKHVSPGGSLIATFRLTDEEGCKEFSKSYQYINFENEMNGEKAAYVVLNANELLGILGSINASEINAYGYWGKPSKTAVTPYKTLCFSAFSIKKALQEGVAPELHLDLPEEIVTEAIRAK